MVVADKNQQGKGQAEKPLNRETPKKPVPDDSLDDLDPNIEAQLTRAKASRVHAEAARQKINSEIMDATKRLYQTLVEEGEQTLERAKKLEAEAELKMLESQRELQHAKNIRQEADSYRQKVIDQTKDQSQEMLQQAQAIKTEAVAFREKMLLDVKQQTSQELDLAQSSRVAADAYQERVIAQTQKQADETLRLTRLTAQQEGTEIKQKYTVEAQKVLAQAELIKAAAEEQLEAQRLYAEAANLQSESNEVLDQARAKVAKDSQHVDIAPDYHALDEEYTLASDVQPEIKLEEISSDSVSNEAPHYEQIIRLDPSPLWIQESVEPAPSKPVSSKGYEPNEPEAVEADSPNALMADADISGLLPDNELVLGLESNHQSRAYPISTIAEMRVINDSMAGLDILVTFGPPSELGMIFKRNLNGRSLTFEPMPKPHNGIALMKDQETGTIWEALTGRAISGPLASNELERLTSEYSFWFAWSQLHPSTEVYQKG